MQTWKLCVAGAVMLVGCSSPEKRESKYPARNPGCEVKIFIEGQVPAYPTDNIGPVRASCDESIADSECMRELQDQACKLGADTIWAVNDRPIKEAGKKRFSGRAAHQK